MSITPIAVRIGENITIANDRPFVFSGGINALEDMDSTLRAAERYVKVTEKLSIPVVLKASFDEANRSSIRSFRGEKGSGSLRK